MNPLSPAQRRALRAKAHHLEPVVHVGQHGLTPAVLREIDVALRAHELVKVRVLGDDRDARQVMLESACAALDCAPVQHLGKLLVLWRPNPDRDAGAPKKGHPKNAAPAPDVRRKAAKARAPVDPVRQRRRMAQGAEVTSAGKARRGAGRVTLPAGPPHAGVTRRRRRG